MVLTYILNGAHKIIDICVDSYCSHIPTHTKKIVALYIRCSHVS